MTPDLSENDAALYRLYAVGMLKYEEALNQAENESRLRRAMLHFDQAAKMGDRPLFPLSGSLDFTQGKDPIA
jgi:hypothetical protein